MVLGGVEVDVVGHLERQVHRDVAPGHEVRLDRARCVAVGQPAVIRRAQRPPGRRPWAMKALREPVAWTVVAGGRGEVEDVVADRDPGPRAAVPGVENTP